MRQFGNLFLEISITESKPRWPCGCEGQRPKKSELSRWQNSTRKNFPDQVRKSFLRKKVCKSFFAATNKVRKSFSRKKSTKIAIWKISRLSRTFPSNQEILQAIQKLSRLFGNFSDHSDTFQTIGKLSRPSRNFPGYPETFQVIRKSSRLSRNFPDRPDYPENFQIIRKLSRLSFFDFYDHPETSQCNFKGYTQKLSGRAKNFRMAMPRCHDGFCASGEGDTLNCIAKYVLSIL